MRTYTPLSAPLPFLLEVLTFLKIYDQKRLEEEVKTTSKMLCIINMRESRRRRWGHWLPATINGLTAFLIRLSLSLSVFLLCFYNIKPVMNPNEHSLSLSLN